MENYLGKYCGLMLYLREMDESRYSKVCAVRCHSKLIAMPLTICNNQTYFSTASDLHNKEVRGLFMKYIELVQRAPEEDEENSACLFNSYQRKTNQTGVCSL
jgi:hypothetical protein